jgi:hypothetical protein
MKRFSVICIQCGLRVDRLVEAETAQTEIHRVTYQQKCKIAPNAADFDCPELETVAAQPPGSRGYSASSSPLRTASIS